MDHESENTEQWTGLGKLGCYGRGMDNGNGNIVGSNYYHDDARLFY